MFAFFIIQQECIDGGGGGGGERMSKEMPREKGNIALDIRRILTVV